MDYFDKAIENSFNNKSDDSPGTICIVGGEQATVESLRALLEVAGHDVNCVANSKAYEEYLTHHNVDVTLVSCQTKVHCEEVFETTSLLSDSTIITGFTSNPSYESAIEFIRCGGADFFNLPEDLDGVCERIQLALAQSRVNQDSIDNTNQIVDLCNQLNEERHRIESEKDSLCNDLANSFCETEKRMKQVAMCAEFKTLINQELDVESMLRTALGYLLTRVGAMNVAVYLREGNVDWGVGAFVNYDRQADHYQTLMNNMIGPVCAAVASEPNLSRYTDGEVFANMYELDAEDFVGSEVITFGCFNDKKCMATIVLFRSDTKPFTQDMIETLESLRQIFGQQLGTILRIYNRAESTWPSESIDNDDDWSFGKAA